jgi:hypothetical protein
LDGRKYSVIFVIINKSTLTLLYQGGEASPLIKGDEEGFI